MRVPMSSLGRLRWMLIPFSPLRAPVRDRVRLAGNGLWFFGWILMRSAPSVFYWRKLRKLKEKCEKKNERKIPPVCWSSHKKYIKVSRDTPYKFRRQELIIKQTSDPNEITKRIFSDASEVCGDLKMREVAYLDTGTRSWNGCHKILSFL